MWLDSEFWFEIAPEEVREAIEQREAIPTRKLKVGMTVQNNRYAGRGKPHAMQELVKLDETSDTAYVRRVDTNGMLAKVKLSNLKDVK